MIFKNKKLMNDHIIQHFILSTHWSDLVRQDWTFTVPSFCGPAVSKTSLKNVFYHFLAGWFYMVAKTYQPWFICETDMFYWVCHS